MLESLQELPIDSIRGLLKRTLDAGMRRIVIQATPGSGKTTRIPRYLLDSLKGRIIVLQPRRVATKTNAKRVADEFIFLLGKNADKCVGWQMRGDVNVSDQAQIVFMTEAMLTVILKDNPELSGVTGVCLDEFHERHLETDLALSLLVRLQQTTRPDLGLFIMSGTLDPGLISEMTKSVFVGAQIINLDQKTFPVEEEFWCPPWLHARTQSNFYNDTLYDRLKCAIEGLIEQKHSSGHILCFLPGSREIAESIKILRPVVDSLKFDLVSLTGSMEWSDQQRVFADHDKRKIILATNVAESSITIPGVDIVIDSGLARILKHDETNGDEFLETRPVSLASLKQRGGRTGRTGPGRILRLFSKQDLMGRDIAEKPEILRLSIDSLILRLRVLGFGMKDLQWLSLPSDPQIERSTKRLIRLNLLNRFETKTTNMTSSDALSIIRDLAFRATPRQIAFAAALPHTLNNYEKSLLVVCLGFLMETSRFDQRNLDIKPSGLHCDLRELYDHAAKIMAGETQSAAARLFLNPGDLRREMNFFMRCFKIKDSTSRRPGADLSIDSAILEVFSDRIAVNRSLKLSDRVNSKLTDKINSKQPDTMYQMINGEMFELSKQSDTVGQQVIVAFNIMGTIKSGSSSALISGSKPVKFTSAPSATRCLAASSISESVFKDWLRTADVQESNELIWNEHRQQVMQLSTRKLGVIELRRDEIPLRSLGLEILDPKMQQGSQIFTAKLLESFPLPYSEIDPLKKLAARLKIAFEYKAIDFLWTYDELKHMVIPMLAGNALSFTEVKDQDLTIEIRSILGEELWQLLALLLPESIKIGHETICEIQYQDDKPPWIEAKLQQFLGTTSTPTVLRGQLMLTLHLLAPNKRPIQVTKDLKSFWTKTYPELRGAYQRDYPRHFWPEDPLNAKPPPRGSMLARRERP